MLKKANLRTCEECCATCANFKYTDKGRGTCKEYILFPNSSLYHRCDDEYCVKHKPDPKLLTNFQYIEDPLSEPTACTISTGLSGVKLKCLSCGDLFAEEEVRNGTLCRDCYNKICRIISRNSMTMGVKALIEIARSGNYVEMSPFRVFGKCLDCGCISSLRAYKKCSVCEKRQTEERKNERKSN